MGTAASTNSPGSSPERSDVNKRSSESTLRMEKPTGTAKPIMPAAGDESKSHLIRTNQVAPIIIKNCKEEFQQIMDFKEPIVMGRMADDLPEHPLIQGRYFLVRDTCSMVDLLNTAKQYLAPNVRQAKFGYPVFGMGQPTRDGLHSIIERLQEEHHEIIMLFNLREEPVFFIPEGYDMIPYSLREQDNLEECIVKGKTAQESRDQEVTIRKEIIDLATLREENKFHCYTSITDFQGQPRMMKIQFEDYLQLSEEMYARPAFTTPKVRYQRLCLPAHGAVSKEDIDTFLNEFKVSPNFFTNKGTVPAMVFSCHTGIGRTNLGMVMGCLMLAHKTGFPDSKEPYPINNKNPSYERGEYLSIRRLVKALPDGLKIKDQVDTLIDGTSELCNIRAEIMNTKKTLEDINSDYIVEGNSAKEYLRQRCVQQLDRYFLLICFNAYLTEQFSQRFCISFSKWMHFHPELVRLRSNLDASEWKAPMDLISQGIRMLVADDYIGLDVLSSQMDVKVSNFRKMVGLPVYGMAQPARAGLSKMVLYLMSKKQGHPKVLVVNLRNDLVVECDGETYGVREKDHLEDTIKLHSISARAIEEREEELRNEVKERKSFQVYGDTSEPLKVKHFGSVLSPREMFEQQQLQTPDLIYKRLPMAGDPAPHEHVFDELVSLLTSLEDIYLDEDGPALVFSCRTGKSRTTTAMAAAGLVLCHQKGFPYGAKPGEQERVSVPNAQYTKGDYLIVQTLVRVIPDGQQVKREVDFILDKCFETMTPMHFHMREVIFVTYNKMKTCKNPDECRLLKWRSLDYLERYLFLILFNAYLHAERRSGWKIPFSVWMKEVAAPADVYEILDNLAFSDFESVRCGLETMRSRWQDRSTKLPFRGVFI